MICRFNGRDTVAAVRVDGLARHGKKAVLDHADKAVTPESEKLVL